MEDKLAVCDPEEVHTLCSKRKSPCNSTTAPHPPKHSAIGFRLTSHRQGIAACDVVNTTAMSSYVFFISNETIALFTIIIPGILHCYSKPDCAFHGKPEWSERGSESESLTARSAR